MEAPEYVHLRPGDAPPSLDDAAPFKAVVVVDADVTPEWQGQISDWLVRSGCRYMMAWGRKCTEWDDSVDEANLARFDFGEIPEDDFVMTTWHDAEPLEEVFEFAEFSAMHPSVGLKKTHIVHISPEAREAEMLRAFRDAREKSD
jgi:hypothetical protein